jgi:hypothetical protein
MFFLGASYLRYEGWIISTKIGKTTWPADNPKFGLGTPQIKLQNLISSYPSLLWNDIFTENPFLNV